mmetsp:Transcript_105105/g.206162  ORF Transcript_105105/g.206162 Transcript_105105/m.206162 type:complete len:86 (-) Transcript_105105:85-342(-)
MLVTDIVTDPLMAMDNLCTIMLHVAMMVVIAASQRVNPLRKFVGRENTGALTQLHKQQHLSIMQLLILVQRKLAQSLVTASVIGN